MLVLFTIMKKFNWLRVEDAMIAGVGGLDMAEHGEYVGLNRRFSDLFIAHARWKTKREW